MPAYKIRYTRADMKDTCTALKFAHTEKEALACLCEGNEKKGLRLARSGVPITLVSVKEIK